MSTKLSFGSVRASVRRNLQNAFSRSRIPDRAHAQREGVPNAGAPAARSRAGSSREWAERGTGALAPRLAALMLRTGQGPLRPVWRMVHAAVIRGATAYLSRGQQRVAVFIKGSFAAGDPVYGLSDVDLAVVAPGDPGCRGLARRRIQERWGRLCRRWPPLRLLVQHFAIYEEEEFRESAAATCLTYGLSGDDDVRLDRAGVLGPAPLYDEMSLQIHPGLLGPGDWKHLSGPDYRLPDPSIPADSSWRIGADRQRRRIAIWLELERWWRYAFEACLNPSGRHVSLLCVKLVAEPLRLWLWLEGGDAPRRRKDVLKVGLRELPAEADAIRLVLDLYAALPKSPTPPLGQVLPALVRLSNRIAQRIEAEIEPNGFADVRLLWGGEAELIVGPRTRERLANMGDGLAAQRLLPLGDWRARTIPEIPDETLMLMSGDPTQPATIAAAARASGSGPYPGLRAGGILILPGTPTWTRGILRGVQCATTDPVSFALADGSETARFPEVAGWSVTHSARRAVAEHHAWLAAPAEIGTKTPYWEPRCYSVAPEIRRLGMLFTAARAAQFLESLEAGAPELPLTVARVAEDLSTRAGGASSMVAAAAENLRVARQDGELPPATLLAELHELVLRLPAYERRRGSLASGERRGEVRDSETAFCP